MRRDQRRSIYPSAHNVCVCVCSIEKSINAAPRAYNACVTGIYTRAQSLIIGLRLLFGDRV